MTNKKLVWITILMLFLLSLWVFKIVEFSWVKVDMGWCQKYGNGLRVLKKVIIELPQQGFSTCV